MSSITTIRDDDNVVVGTVTVDRDFVAPKVPGFPKWSSIRNPQWVAGVTLERVSVVGGVPKNVSRGDTIETLVKCPSSNMEELECDRCAGPHKASVQACSANLGLPTPFDVDGALYDRGTGEMVKQTWEVVDESSNPK